MSAALAAAPVPVRPPAAVPARPAPEPFRWTIAQYRELGKNGLFHDMKTLLLHGELYAMVMPNPPHDVALGLADDWLRTVFPVGYSVRNQQGFDISIRNDPGPDLAVVVGGRRDHATKTPRKAVLAIEVADSSP